MKKSEYAIKQVVQYLLHPIVIVIELIKDLLDVDDEKGIYN